MTTGRLGGMNTQMQKRLTHLLVWLEPLSRNRDVTFALVLSLVLAVLFVPLPSLLIDVGLALSIAVSVLMLMVALWVNKPLEFSSFPTLLLVVTVMRLAFEVASSRKILSHGQEGPGAAGHVIEGIANFVVGGDFVIGAVMFAILVVINFIVITKGSTRIAEVSARFSLDAMPGKQMAIDADLGSGLIDEAEAKRRRAEVEGESSFFGAMDGAAKFVRGDAVAGIIITFVNIFGGLLIGTLRHDMSILDALQNYTVLTIGDGLATQIPALIVSIAAGMIVTKGAQKGAANEAILDQLGNTPKALYVSAGILALLGVLPGFPLTIFWVLAAALMLLGLLSARKSEAAAAEAVKAKERQERGTARDDPKELVKIDTIRLELGSGLVMLFGGPEEILPGKVKSLRKMIAESYGFIMPMMWIGDNSTLPDNTYVISIQGVEAARGELKPGARLLIDPEKKAVDFPGTRIKEPTFGLDAVWIDAIRAPEAEARGFTVVDPESALITHLTEVIVENLPDLLSYGATQQIVQGLDRDYQKLINDIAGGNPVLLLENVLQRLLMERVSIRNIKLIVEAVSEAAISTKNLGIITENVRRRLSSQICASVENDSGIMELLTLGPSWETEFAQSIKRNGDDITCVMSPKRVQDFIVAARVEIEKFARKDQWPALLVNADLRPIIRSMLERVSPMTPIISHAEVHRKAKLKTVGVIGA